MKKIIIQNMKNKGFTLLELLVVIGIIGIMMALATVAYSSIQSRSRDSRRKQDLVAIQNALEQYYSEHSYVYPTTNCDDVAVDDTYLKSAWPLDPDSTTDVPVQYEGYNECTPTSYCICAVLDVTTGGNSGEDCDWGAVGKTRYCVENLQ